MTKTMRELRKMKAMTQKQLASRSGLSIGTIRAYEKSVHCLRQASFENAQRVAQALGLTIDDIFLEDASVFLNREK